MSYKKYYKLDISSSSYSSEGTNALYLIRDMKTNSYYDLIGGKTIIFNNESSDKFPLTQITFEEYRKQVLKILRRSKEQYVALMNRLYSVVSERKNKR